MWEFFIVGIAGGLVGYFSRFAQEKYRKPIIKDEIDELLDEIESCGEIKKVEIIESPRYNKLKQICFTSGIIMREGRSDGWRGDGSCWWYESPKLFVKDVSLNLSTSQKRRVQTLIDKKHAESGRQQITCKLLGK